MSTVNKNYVFFLGGYDAEMLGIKDILIKYNYVFYDKQLQWGKANLSEYKNEIITLKANEIPVLIELTLDVALPSNSLIIDHHNDNENKLSSIEQFAELIGIRLDRWQQLIAANDKGYIQAMKSLCATESEIKKVRETDRRAQGVTEDDERLAVLSIEKNLKVQDGMTVIKSLTNKFSPITDRIHDQINNLLIYTDDELVYYGKKKKQIINKYKSLIEEKKAYYGGHDLGFFGIVKGSLSSQEIENLKEKIIQLNLKNEEKLYSHHIFLFPFKWEKINPKDDTLEEKFDVKFFRHELTKGDWKRKPFNIECFDHYNEFNYFYDYVREIMYDLDRDLDPNPNDEDLLNHFEYIFPEGYTYNIKLGDQEIFSLIIDSILLNVYRTGTAVLSFHLRNHSYSDQRDILKINKFGRRLYVPFFDLEPDSIYTGNSDKTSKEKLLCATKKSEIPDAMWIGNPGIQKDDKLLFEDFEKFKEIKNIKKGPFILPRFIEGLFLTKLLTTDKYKNKGSKIFISPVLDDRMHVVSWYGNTELVNSLNKISECTDFALEGDYINDNRDKKNRYSFENSESKESQWWYSYIFCDSPEPMHKDRFVRQKLLQENTYSRWIDWGTLFGMSRFSFVMLTSNFSDLGEATFLVRHLQSIYYKMAELCLVQRTTMLSFSDEVTHVSNLLSKQNTSKNKGIDKAKIKNSRVTLNKIDNLYKHYILFVNKIYFREVTTQEQGIELYDMMQNIMRIPRDVKDLDDEIGELNQFASKEEAHNLTRIATLFIIPTLIASLLGMNVLPDFDKIPSYLFGLKLLLPFLTSIILIVLITFLTIRYDIVSKVYKFFKGKKN